MYYHRIMNRLMSLLTHELLCTFYEDKSTYLHLSIKSSVGIIDYVSLVFVDSNIILLIVIMYFNNHLTIVTVSFLRIFEH